MDNIDWQDLLFQFDGRINRAKYWLGFLIVAVAGVIVAGIAAAVNSNAFWGLAGLALLALLWPSIAIEIKRWHDRDKSGWWWLIRLVPFIGGLWVLIECGFLEGTQGPNQYGPDPLGGGIADDMAM